MTNLPAGTASGLATLDGTGKLTASQLPATAVSPFKGSYDDLAGLQADYPTGSLADYAFIKGTVLSYYYWNPELTTPAWVDQKISQTAYNDLTPIQKAVVPYIVNTAT